MSDNSVVKAAPSLSDASQAKITSMDVAKLAGVSQSAVSRVFTKGASASAKQQRKCKMQQRSLDIAQIE